MKKAQSSLFTLNVRELQYSANKFKYSIVDCAFHFKTSYS